MRSFDLMWRQEMGYCNNDETAQEQRKARTHFAEIQLKICWIIFDTSFGFVGR